MKKYISKSKIVKISLILAIVIIATLGVLTQQTMSAANTLSDSQVIELKPGHRYGCGCRRHCCAHGRVAFYP